jgi:hypothetical protein
LIDPQKALFTPSSSFPRKRESRSLKYFWTPAFAGVTAFPAFYGINKLDEFVESQKAGFSVIPAKAGIQLFQDVLDPGFRRGDDPRDFLRDHQACVH